MGGLQAFLAMGGYGEFVWPAYAAALAVIGGLALQSWRRYRASLLTLEQLQATRKRR